MIGFRESDSEIGTNQRKWSPHGSAKARNVVVLATAWQIKLQRTLPLHKHVNQLGTSSPYANYMQCGIRISRQRNLFVSFPEKFAQLFVVCVKCPNKTTCTMYIYFVSLLASKCFKSKQTKQINFTYIQVGAPCNPWALNIRWQTVNVTINAVGHVKIARLGRESIISMLSVRRCLF